MACCADYTIQREAFHSLLRDDSPTKVLLYQGLSGSGKTHLITSCRQEIPKEVSYIPITFRQNYDTPLAEIFHRTCQNIGWDDMPYFQQEVARRQEAPSLKLQGVTQIGSQHSIQIILQDSDVSQQRDNQLQLTKVWFDDLSQRKQLTLWVFDGYEKAPSETQEWLNGPFLGRVAMHSCMRVVITGQQTPDPNNIEWGHCAQRHGLYGVHEAEHWMPVIQEMQRGFPPSIKNPEDWLAGVCHALNGSPSEIIKIIETLPPLRETNHGR